MPHWYKLSHLSLIRVQGEQAAAFLQGQLSCDIREVTENTLRPAALCNLKGRIIALMHVVNWQGLAIILPHDLIPLVEQDLKAVARLSRVSLVKDETVQLYGVHHEADLEGAYPLAPELYLYLSTTSVEAIDDPEAWQRLLIERNQMRIYPQTSGQFLPQALGLDETPCFSFNKGCYKGQEVIARMHYLGKSKYNLKKTTLTSTTPLRPGMGIYNPAQQLIGELVDLAQLDQTHYLLLASVLDTQRQDFLNGRCVIHD